MAKRSVTTVLVLWLLAGVGGVHAAGDAEAGEVKSAACVVCHGTAGNSIRPEWPSLAGQVPEYLVKQLQDFKSGARQNPVMANIVGPLSAQDMEDLAAYFASQTMKVSAPADMKQAQQGERLYRGGNVKMLVSACMSCHGPSGRGIPPRFPRVSGQQAVYSEIQLLAFKAGKRSNDNEVMTRIAFRMSESDIKAVAHYMSGLK
ncbi:MAG: cytochrome c4 [Gammaproteobacteria bacterium]|nr:cytochrome c4 [Gammaproteobacteria bacterium]